MRSGPSILVPFAAVLASPAVLYPAVARACVGVSFQIISPDAKPSTGIQFLTVADGDDAVSRRPKFLVATEHSKYAYPHVRPVFSLTAGDVQIPVTLELYPHPSSAPRLTTLWVVSPKEDLTAGTEYTLTGSIGEPTSIRFKASDAPAVTAPVAARLSQFRIERTEHHREFGGTCYPPPFYYGTYEWEASDAAVVVYQTDEAGRKHRLLGAWRGSGKDQVMLQSGATEAGLRCIVLESYAPDLSFVATAPVCRTHNDNSSGDGSKETVDAGGVTNDAGAVTNDGGTDAPTAEAGRAGGCNMSAADVGKGSWPLWGLLAAIWLRRRLSRTRMPV